MTDRHNNRPSTLSAGQLIQPTDDPFAVTTDELENLFDDIVQVLQNGAVVKREALNVFLTAPRTNWQTSDVLRVLDMLEKSNDSHDAKDRVIRSLIGVIRRLVSAQMRPFLSERSDALGMVGEVEWTRETVRLSVRSSSVSSSVSPDTQRLINDHMASDSGVRSSSVLPSVSRPFDNVENGHALPYETDANHTKRTTKTDGKNRKEYVVDARQKADKYLRRNKGGIQMSAAQLAQRLSISKTVAAEALKDARAAAKDQTNE